MTMGDAIKRLIHVLIMFHSCSLEIKAPEALLQLCRIYLHY